MLERTYLKVAKMLHDARRHPRVLRIPTQTLAANLVHKPDRTTQQRDQTPHRRCRRVPQPRRHRPDGGDSRSRAHCCTIKSADRHSDDELHHPAGRDYYETLKMEDQLNFFAQLVREYLDVPS